MAAHKTNGLLKFVLIPVIAIVLVVSIYSRTHSSKEPKEAAIPTNPPAKNTASRDSAAESLDTLTARLTATQQKVNTFIKNNESLQQKNQQLLNRLQNKKDDNDNLLQQLNELQAQVKTFNKKVNNNPINIQADAPQPIMTVPELADTLGDPKERTKQLPTKETGLEQKKPAVIPFYTIPANSTAVEDRLMTPLVGRIPVKGVVTDPYPFKIVFSDNTLAANGWRVPNLRQMIVSGYTEGDLNLVSTRGWVTSLTFVFADGTISTTSSNDNNIGKFSKDNALGYLSDEQGNPAIRGQLITNAPAYLGTSVLLGAAQGAANAYAQSQTSNSSTLVGTQMSSVSGSPAAYVTGQAMSNATEQVLQWWHDREENSFDAVFVSTMKASGEPQKIVVNFAKQISIDYDPEGRKIVYAHPNHSHVALYLD